MKELATDLGPFYYREDTYDYEIIREQRRVYNRLPLENETVLDLGSNIGSFHRFAMLNGAKEVIALEPEPSNCKINTMNLTPNVVLIEKAVVSDDYTESSINFYVTNSANKGTSSIRPRRNSTQVCVETVGIGKVLKLRPFSVMKCDIEGAEYNLFKPGLTLPPSLHSIAIAYHFGPLAYTTGCKAAHDYFVSQGFININRVPFEKKCFSSVVHYRRSV